MSRKENISNFWSVKEIPSINIEKNKSIPNGAANKVRIKAR